MTETTIFLDRLAGQISEGSGVGGHRAFADLPGSRLTLLQRSGTLASKERRNSSKSGTHLRQTGGFFCAQSSGCKPMRCLRREGG